MTTPNLFDNQQRLWNGPGGQAWVDSQQLLDALFSPLLPPLLQGLGAGARVLDIGCGTGATSLAAADISGDCLGIDISAPMLELAQMRAESAGNPARFVCADAQAHDFAENSFDWLISRFGVMFFADPQAAFANLRRGAASGARMRLLAWRGAEDNPFMVCAERAAAPWLPALPLRRPGAPGQFAFADAARVHGILQAAGWDDIGIRPLDVPLSMPEAALQPYLSRLGPVGLVLQQLPEEERAALLARLRQAFEPFVKGGRVEFPAACWLIEARARG
ncbi:class I SAM-dependent methyltransferase [Pseudomonas sp. Gutcm_11s]|uniref:class I SAM-dependent methyltransferase n=1 Tax=Pseudomonas sp. Gutcm_11s TaxID=3026088 RepID=UPI00235ED84E|nr:class I SAM-dependent methyltransferase [Pseudomonas sp. Gutcm_11s]MDD0843088.1 class I SAM-dependent methyltransferase [Pseudomonas sp. Gutcm_11s]